MLPELHRNISTKTTTWYFIRPYRFWQAEQFRYHVQADKAESLENNLLLHQAGRCAEKNSKTFGTATEGIDRSRIPHSTAFKQTPEVKLSLYRNELTVTRKNEVNQSKPPIPCF